MAKMDSLTITLESPTVGKLYALYAASGRQCKFPDFAVGMLGMLVDGRFNVSQRAFSKFEKVDQLSPFDVETNALGDNIDEFKSTKSKPKKETGHLKALKKSDHRNLDMLVQDSLRVGKLLVENKTGMLLVEIGHRISRRIGQANKTMDDMWRAGLARKKQIEGSNAMLWFMSAKTKAWLKMSPEDQVKQYQERFVEE
jgi:hypothetical protein